MHAEALKMHAADVYLPPRSTVRKKRSKRNELSGTHKFRLAFFQEFNHFLLFASYFCNSLIKTKKAACQIHHCTKVLRGFLSSYIPYECVCREFHCNYIHYHA